MCPKAYEPLALPQNTRRRAVRLVLGPRDDWARVREGSEGSLQLSLLSFSFSGSTAMLKSNVNEMDGAECTRLLGELKSVDSATCERESMDLASGAGSYLIRINDYPLFPHENNIFNHTGNPPLSAFRCNVTGSVEDGDGEFLPPVCSIENVVADNLPGYHECSFHGTCNRADGVCSCERGFHGPACDDTSDASVRHLLSIDAFSSSHHLIYFFNYKMFRTKLCTTTTGPFSPALS